MGKKKEALTQSTLLALPKDMSIEHPCGKTVSYKGSQCRVLGLCARRPVSRASSRSGELPFWNDQVVPKSVLRRAS